MKNPMDTEPPKTLLLVDDEENILRALTRLFRRQGYQILTANSGAAGLDVLKEHPVGVIISDQRMPEMTGIEFLHEVNQRYPNTMRIMLSGYSGLEAITESVNCGAVFKFLPKAGEDDLLSKNVQEAFRIYEQNVAHQQLAQQLQKHNQQLEQQHEEKTRALQLNLSALTASQDIFEKLPILVLGISEDQIVVTNRRARELFTDPPVQIGIRLEEAVPPTIHKVYQQTVEKGRVIEAETELHGNQYRCRCQPNSSGNHCNSYILTMRER